MFLPISWFYAIIFLISAQKFCPKWGVTECQNGTETKQFEIGWWNEKTSKGFISEPFWCLTSRNVTPYFRNLWNSKFSTNLQLRYLSLKTPRVIFIRDLELKNWRHNSFWLVVHISDGKTHSDWLCWVAGSVVTQLADIISLYDQRRTEK